MVTKGKSRDTAWYSITRRAMAVALDAGARALAFGDNFAKDGTQIRNLESSRDFKPDFGDHGTGPRSCLSVLRSMKARRAYSTLLGRDPDWRSSDQGGAGPSSSSSRTRRSKSWRRPAARPISRRLHALL